MEVTHPSAIRGQQGGGMWGGRGGGGGGMPPLEIRCHLCSMTILLSGWSSSPKNLHKTHSIKMAQQQPRVRMEIFI